VLLLQPPIPGPSRSVLHGDRCLCHVAAVNHVDIEAMREIVHEDPERWIRKHIQHDDI